MNNIVAMSGSTIYSNPELFEELYLDGVEHIEIGEFAKEADFYKFYELNKEKGKSYGIHSPLIRGNSKYDLIEKVNFEPKDAWNNLEKEAEMLSKLGAKYLLVHFPYFKGEVEGNPNGLIEEGLGKLKEIQEKHKIKILCEPKLGMNRSRAGIEYLQSFPIEIWRRYNISLCIDIGDYIIAVGDSIIEYLSRWKEFIRGAHLHNIHYTSNEYIWMPIHPSQESDGISHKVKEIIEFLASCNDVTFVFEHTPETNPKKEFVIEGVRWTNKLIKNY